MYKNLDDYIIIFENALPEKQLIYLNSYIRQIEYVKHAYYDNFLEKTKSNSYDLDISKNPDFEDLSGLRNPIQTAIENYIKFFKLPFFRSVKTTTVVRINRYLEDTSMDLHCDHIYSMFDGKIKGIPVLSVLGALNDDYEGGELIFFENTKINLNAGDIMVFPSNFLFPHRVEKVTRGARYSFVSWAA